MNKVHTLNLSASTKVGDVSALGNEHAANLPVFGFRGMVDVSTVENDILLV